MPVWLANRLKNLPFYAIVILALGFLLYSAFIKPTQKITANKGSTVYVSNTDKEVPILGCSMYKFRAKIVWQ